MNDEDVVKEEEEEEDVVDDVGIELVTKEVEVVSFAFKLLRCLICPPSAPIVVVLLLLLLILF